jgi:hypothetical protein
MTTVYRNSQDINHCSTRDYCIDCFADIESEFICDRIVGYDAETGYPIVDVTEEEWTYLHNKSEKGEA